MRAYLLSSILFAGLGGAGAVNAYYTDPTMWGPVALFCLAGFLDARRVWKALSRGDFR